MTQCRILLWALAQSCESAALKLLPTLCLCAISDNLVTHSACRRINGALLRTNGYIKGIVLLSSYLSHISFRNTCTIRFEGIGAKRTKTSIHTSRLAINMTERKKTMPYGASPSSSHYRSCGDPNRYMSRSPLGQLGSQSLQNHPRMYDIRYLGVAKMGSE